MQKNNTLQTAYRLLAKCCGLDAWLIEAAVTAVSSSPSGHYTEIKKRKKSGKLRIIHAPDDDLKTVQAALVPFLYRWSISERMYGFKPKRSPVENARYHITIPDRHNPKKAYGYELPRWILTVDLKDAFPSVTSQLLEEMYRKMFSPSKLVGWQGLTETEATLVHEKFIGLMLTLTTYEDRLPQGAPTSPYLLNLALCHTGVIDRIESLCIGRKKKFLFSIYADDITISSRKEKISDAFLRKVINAIEQDGWFKVNPQKIRRNSRKYKAHQITGIVLTEGTIRQRKETITPLSFMPDGTTQKGEPEYYDWKITGPKLALSQKDLRSLRGQIHSARLTLASADANASLNQFNQIMGKIAWVRMVYRGYPLPPSVKKEILAFEQEWDKRRDARRTEYREHLKALSAFLFLMASRKN